MMTRSLKKGTSTIRTWYRISKYLRSKLKIICLRTGAHLVPLLIMKVIMINPQWMLWSDEASHSLAFAMWEASKKRTWVQRSK
jgi:hypothetical protein